MKIVEEDFVTVFVCPICGKKFATIRPEMWAWKYTVLNKNHTRLERVCSYPCMLEGERRENLKRKQKRRVT